MNIEMTAASHLGMKYYATGVKAAQGKLISWDLPDNGIRQDMINDIEIYMDRVLKSIQAGYTSSFAMGYFHTLAKRNDPILNKIIEPFINMRHVQ